MLKYATELSDSARIIGAINTFYPLGDGKYYGTNTDWIGITESFKNNGVYGSAMKGLIIGGGGTSRAAVYAFKQMGCKKIYMLNRTVSKLQEIKVSFPSDYNIEILDSSSVPNIENIDLVVSTVPANVDLDPEFTSNIRHVLSKGSGPKAFIEAAYKPLVTPLMTIANEEFMWNVIPGREMLVNQGIAQFQEFCGIKPPYDEVFEAVTSE